MLGATDPLRSSPYVRDGQLVAADVIDHISPLRAPRFDLHLGTGLGTGGPLTAELGMGLAHWVSEAGCDRLVVSLGVDAAADDPESPLQVTADGYREAGRLLGATGLPTVAVQEGGYHLPTLGGLVAAYLEGHATA